MSVRRTGLISASAAAAMLGLAFASVPLYRMFCEATGFDGTPQRADAAPAQATDRLITVRFDANTAGGNPWEFRPEQRTQTIRIGQKSLAYFKAVNPTDRRTGGQAVFNVSPETLGKYFVKIQCFCFNEQTLEPGQSVDMPVVYFIDPAILEDRYARTVGEVTLSYTFYPMAPEPVKTAAESRSAATNTQG